MSQNYVYPSSSDVTLTGTPNNAPIPSTSILVAGENPSGNQKPVQTDEVGNLIVSPLTTASVVTVVQPDGTLLHTTVDSSALPAGASTAANQALEITQLDAINTNTTGVSTAANQALEITQLDAINTNTTGVSTAANQATEIASLATIAANTTGVSTAANQATEIASLAAIQDNQTNGTQVTQIASGSALIGSVSINQTTPGTTNGVVVNSSVLPTGASTSALQTQISAQLPTTLGQKTSAASLAVVLPSDGTLPPTTGRSVANAPVYNIYSSTNITTSAYVQLIASTTLQANFLDIFDSSGSAMILAVGASGSEVIQAYISPGGDRVPLKIPAGSRIAYKALNINATSGYLLVNLLT